MSDIPNVLERIETRILEALSEREVLEERIKTIDKEIKRLSTFSASLIRQAASEITKEAANEPSTS